MASLPHPPTDHSLLYFSKMPPKVQPTEAILERLRQVDGTHASEDTKLRAMKMVFEDKIATKDVATIFSVSTSTMYAWVEKFTRTLSVARCSNPALRDGSFTEEHRDKIVAYYMKKPTIYMDEVQVKFKRDFHLSISTATICRILKERGMTRKKLERIAHQRSIIDQIRYSAELAGIFWLPEMLTFWDEVGFDNRDCWRKHGYCLMGLPLQFKAEFTRKPMVSLLCVLGAEGLLQSYHTEGTFDRLTFFGHLQHFVLTSCHPYPGKNSIIILDGASIHRDENIVNWCRSKGVYVFFLPAYAPIYNPIENFFAMVKRELQRQYSEESKISLTQVIANVLATYVNYNMRGIYRHCGYTSLGFDLTKNDKEFRLVTDDLDDDDEEMEI
jgi:transposase